jgi:hypothetical protein
MVIAYLVLSVGSVGEYHIIYINIYHLVTLPSCTVSPLEENIACGLVAETQSVFGQSGLLLEGTANLDHQGLSSVSPLLTITAQAREPRGSPFSSQF